METQSPAPAAPQKKRNWVPIIIVVGVIVLIVIGVGVWRLTSDDSAEAGKPAGQSAKAVFAGWQNGNRAAAARFASDEAVTKLFAISTSDASGLRFGGCSPTTDDPFPRECVWSRPGGELTMEVEKQGDTPIVTKVTYGPAGLPPDTSSSDSTG
jgi:hypothetical protein